MDQLQANIDRIAEDLLKKYGPEAAVVIMVGVPEGKEHSQRRWAWRGRCLPVEGLLTRCAEDIRQNLWKA